MRQQGGAFNHAPCAAAGAKTSALATEGKQMLRMTEPPGIAKQYLPSDLRHALPAPAIIEIGALVPGG